MELKLSKSKTDSSIYNGPNQEDFNSLKKTVAQMNQSYVSIGKRLDNLEKEQHILVRCQYQTESNRTAQ